MSATMKEDSEGLRPILHLISDFDILSLISNFVSKNSRRYLSRNVDIIDALQGMPHFANRGSV